MLVDLPNLKSMKISQMEIRKLKIRNHEKDLTSSLNMFFRRTHFSKFMSVTIVTTFNIYLWPQSIEINCQYLQSSI